MPCLSRSASGCPTGTRTLKSGVSTSRRTAVGTRSSGCATSATHAGISSGRVVSIRRRPGPRHARSGRSAWRPAPRGPRIRCATAVRSRRPRVALRAIRLAVAHQARNASCEMRCACADRRVGQRPVDRQSSGARASRTRSSSAVSARRLDEVGPRDRLQRLRRLGGAQTPHHAATTDRTTQ